MYINHYYHCNVEWTDEWDCMCDDECPTCGHEIEPYMSEDEDGDMTIHSPEVEANVTDGVPCCTVCGDSVCTIPRHSFWNAKPTNNKDVSV